MSFPRLLRRESTALLVIDIQQKLVGAMPPARGPELVKRSTLLIEGMKVLGVPVLATEQYPKGLGPTVPEILQRLPEAPLDKVEFSACASERAKKALTGLSRQDIVLCGMEAHVCVYQTAIDLLREDKRVFIPEDAVLSRREEDRRVGLRLMERAGAIVTSTETILFELLGSAGDPAFKEISRLVR